MFTESVKERMCSRTKPGLSEWVMHRRAGIAGGDCKDRDLTAAFAGTGEMALLTETTDRIMRRSGTSLTCLAGRAAASARVMPTAALVESASRSVQMSINAPWGEGQ